jgi:antitoxin HigA-1
MATIAPIHPGEVLLEEFREPLGVTQHRRAVSIGVPPRRINEIVHGKRRITADTALRLARYFGTTDRFWLNLQTRYDLEVEKATWATSLRRSVHFSRLDRHAYGLPVMPMLLRRRRRRR